VARDYRHTTGCLKAKRGIALSPLCPVLALDSVNLTKPPSMLLCRRISLEAFSTMRELRGSPVGVEHNFPNYQRCLEFASLPRARGLPVSRREFFPLPSLTDFRGRKHVYTTLVLLPRMPKSLGHCLSASAQRPGPRRGPAGLRPAGQSREGPGSAGGPCPGLHGGATSRGTVCDCCTTRR
jgi:hypothetical protein